MSNLNVKFKKILDDLENNIKNKEDLEYVKSQMLNLYNLFFDELNESEKRTTEKNIIIEKTQVELEERIAKLENKITTIEKELYLDEEDEDFSITCPYCNNEFIIDSEELQEEIECPQCNNIIELDWGSDDCSCGNCEHDCKECNHDEDDDM